MSRRRRSNGGVLSGYAINYPKGGLGGGWGGQSQRAYREPRHRTSWRNQPRRSYRQNEIDPRLLALGFASFLVLWIFYEIMIFIQEQWASIVLGVEIFGLLVIVGLIYLGYKWNEKRKWRLLQQSKGLIKFVSCTGDEKWGSQKEVENWEKADEKIRQQIEQESLPNKVVQAIKDFTPFRQYKNEFPYQLDLARYLKEKFPNVVIEQQKGSSRPDIVVGNDIAIEVKGPTDNNALNTLTTKCLKYSGHYQHLIIVLFEPTFSEGNYNEIINGMKRSFPEVKVVRKD